VNVRTLLLGNPRPIESSTAAGQVAATDGWDHR